MIPVDLDLVRKYDLPTPRYTSYPTAAQFREYTSPAPLLAHVDAANHDASLPLDRVPMEAQRRARIGREFRGFRACQIGKEGESAGIGALEEQHANVRCTLCIRRRHGHGRRLGLAGARRFLQPGVEPFDRIEGDDFAHVRSQAPPAQVMGSNCSILLEPRLDKNGLA